VIQEYYTIKKKIITVIAVNKGYVGKCLRVCSIKVTLYIYPFKYADY